MKNLLTLLIVILAFSCKKGHEEPTKEEEIVNLYVDSQLLGKWEYIAVKVNGVTSPYSHMKGCQKDAFYFFNQPEKDHDYVEVIFKANCSTHSSNLDWKIKGENLILNFGPQEFIYKILRLTPKNFDVSINVDFDGDGKIDKVELYFEKGTCQIGDPFCQL